MTDGLLKVEYKTHPEHIEAVVTGELVDGEAAAELKKFFSMCIDSGIYRVIIDTINLGGERTASGGLFFGMMFENLYNELSLDKHIKLKVAFIRDENKVLEVSPEFEIYKKPHLDVGVFYNRDEGLAWVLEDS